MTLLIRSFLLTAALVVATFVLVAHGTRGVVALVVVALVITAPGTRVWKTTEQYLVRLTGSRQRALLLVTVLVILVLVAVNVVDYLH